MYAENQQRNRYTGFILAWGLEKYTSPEKCFDYVKIVENEELLKIYNESLIKDLKTLKDTMDILKYILITEKPNGYKRNPDLLLKNANRLKNKLKS
ncbi:MAG: hypothetical protein HC905_20630 [Bacteroidales bacterium]|nr:hypothetical protein [Bacteroidales bacterium]